MKITPWLELIVFYSHILISTPESDRNGNHLKRVMGSSAYRYIDSHEWALEVDRLSGRLDADTEVYNYQTLDLSDEGSGKKSFKISKPKPWRRDDEIAVRANRKAEVPAQATITKLELKGA